MSASLKSYLEACSRKIEPALKHYLRRRPEEPEEIRRAMRHSLFAGGKRLRPILVQAAAECCGLEAEKALPTACGVEMIHTYSLIHDDLPSMDDDDLRRGKPACHKAFGEATAILAGDGLLTYAFEVMAQNAREPGVGPDKTVEAIRIVAAGAGTRGMVGGQVEDLKAEGFCLNGNRRGVRRLLERIHLQKTSALIAACLEAGAVLAGASSRERQALKSYGLNIGLAFQISDDILDVVGNKEKLGKKGSDTHNRKLTYASLHGIPASRRQARRLIQKAHEALKPLGEKGRPLHDLADYIIQRDH